MTTPRSQTSQCRQSALTLRTSTRAREHARAVVLTLCCLASMTIAALPPGYDEELFCPPGHCLLPKKTTPGFTGPRAMFLSCASTDGTGARKAMPVQGTWGMRLGEDAKSRLLAGGLVVAEPCRRTQGVDAMAGDSDGHSGGYGGSVSVPRAPPPTFNTLRLRSSVPVHDQARQLQAAAPARATAHCAGCPMASSTHDADTVRAARAALRLESAKSGKALELVRVIRATTQVVAGIKYHFVLEVKHPNSPAYMHQRVRATVWWQAWQRPQYRLLAFADADAMLGPGAGAAGQGHLNTRARTRLQRCLRGNGVWPRLGYHHRIGGLRVGWPGLPVPCGKLLDLGQCDGSDDDARKKPVFCTGVFHHPPIVRFNAAALDPNAREYRSRRHVLVLVDPDAPSPRHPRCAQWLHWLVVNIPNARVPEGRVVTPFNPPTPPIGTHRYLLLVFEQALGPKGCASTGSCDQSVAEMAKVRPPTSRCGFDVRRFAREHSLGQPIAAHLFRAKP